MRILAVCVWIVAGALVHENDDVIGGTILAVIGAAVYFWDIEERRFAAKVEKSEQDANEGKNS